MAVLKASKIEIAMILVCISSSASAAGRVFSDDFESGTTNAWEKDSYHAKCEATSVAKDGKGPHRGTEMAICNWNGVVDWSDALSYSGLALSSWSYAREFLIRYWVRFDADCDSKFGAKAFRLYPDNGTESYYWGAQLESSGGPVFSFWEEINGNSGPELYGTLPLDDGNWHKFEISNWSDNGPEWSHDENNHTYWDDFEIFSDQGSGATGNMSDASIQQGGTTQSPPAAPANLRVM